MPWDLSVLFKGTADTLVSDTETYGTDRIEIVNVNVDIHSDRHSAAYSSQPGENTYYLFRMSVEPTSLKRTWCKLNSAENRMVADSWAKSQISRRVRHLSELKPSREKLPNPTSCLNVCQWRPGGNQLTPHKMVSQLNVAKLWKGVQCEREMLGKSDRDTFPLTGKCARFIIYNQVLCLQNSDNMVS